MPATIKLSHWESCKEKLLLILRRERTGGKDSDMAPPYPYFDYCVFSNFGILIGIIHLYHSECTEENHEENARIKAKQM